MKVTILVANTVARLTPSICGTTGSIVPGVGTNMIIVIRGVISAGAGA